MIAKTQPIHSFRVRAISGKRTQFEVSHYFIGHRIGKGGYSVVHQAVEKITKADLAVKIIDLSLFSPSQVARLRQEVEILRIVDHPNIVRIYEFIEEDSKLYIFMELIKGQQLFQYVREKGPLPQQKVAKIFFQICQAVKYLHSQGIIHRDIKAENIVVDANFNAKLVDFGLAKRLNLQSKDFYFCSTICGSPSYISPQLLAKRRYDGQKVDIWCLGVTLYIMLQAKLPFDQDGADKTKQNIFMMAWDKPDISSAEAIKIYKSVFVKQSERLNIHDMLDSSFLRKYIRSGQKFENKKEIQKLAIKRAADLLQQSQESVKEKVNGRQLGTAYSIYNLIAHRTQSQTRHQKARRILQNPNGTIYQIKGTKKRSQPRFQVQKQQKVVEQCKKTRSPRIGNRKKVGMETSVLKYKKQISQIRRQMARGGSRGIEQTKLDGKPSESGKLMLPKFLHLKLEGFAY